jgi:hypothetical protein
MLDIGVCMEIRRAVWRFWKHKGMDIGFLYDWVEEGMGWISAW